MYRCQTCNPNAQISIANRITIVSFQSEESFEDFPDPSNACTPLPVAVPFPEPETLPGLAKLVA